MVLPAGGLPVHDADAQVERIVDELADRFRGTFEREAVARFVRESYALLSESATVRTHLPALTARFARERLLDRGRASGLLRVEVPQVLFVCVHNAGRSQMAAALLDHHAFGRVAVRSAGSRPTREIPETVTAALAELGVSLTSAYPKPLTDEVVRAADVVVTMGCGDACPVFPGRRYLDWAVPDPDGQPPAAVRRIRDDMDARVRGLLDELTP
ncbi:MULTISPECIES: arsenate reductase ArsC [Amycolatopsis]|uniref:Arsenate reductase ArsC n=1 Tax=Amycolatopsis echigonensis TaxID=2576905 RepID=A0A2N3WLJ7_9PSEU|nr:MULTISPECIES: arsenate reductase ArsC [Amycolatopsis]MBB2500782.1 arsenate reductase ArsC [Amycolatopsis echigonensis]MCG3751261.1 arsenate reductase ArsC [Amycolatopsis sp. Poz14]PKV94726.1 protein-tyrosine-phosphatase [Amycolatopsis niigatensis]